MLSTADAKLAHAPKQEMEGFAFVCLQKFWVQPSIDSSACCFKWPCNSMLHRYHNQSHCITENQSLSPNEKGSVAEDGGGDIENIVVLVSLTAVGAESRLPNENDPEDNPTEFVDTPSPSSRKGIENISVVSSISAAAAAAAATRQGKTGTVDEDEVSALPGKAGTVEEDAVSERSVTSIELTLESSLFVEIGGTITVVFIAGADAPAVVIVLADALTPIGVSAIKPSVLVTVAADVASTVGRGIVALVDLVSPIKSVLTLPCIRCMPGIP